MKKMEKTNKRLKITYWKVIVGFKKQTRFLNSNANLTAKIQKSDSRKDIALASGHKKKSSIDLVNIKVKK